MKTRKFAVAIATFASAALLAACGNVSTTNTSAAGSTVGETFKIGYNLELSGNVSSYGQTEENGANLAVKEINAAGGIDGKIEVITKTINLKPLKLQRLQQAWQVRVQTS